MAKALENLNEFQSKNHFTSLKVAQLQKIKLQKLRANEIQMLEFIFVGIFITLHCNFML